MNNEPIIHNKLYPLEQTQKEPIVQFNKSKLCTIVMVDPDAPMAKVKGQSFGWLHWLVVNSNINEPITLYNGPKPPSGSGIHRYFIYLFEQKEPMHIEGSYNHGIFDLEQFIRKYELVQLSCVMFRTQYSE